MLLPRFSSLRPTGLAALLLCSAALLLAGCAGSGSSRSDRMSIDEFTRRLKAEGLSVKRQDQTPDRFPSATSAAFRVSTDLVEVYELPPGFSAELNRDELNPPPSEDFVYYQRGNLIVVQRGGFRLVREALTNALSGG